MSEAIQPEERTAIYDLFRALHQLALVQEENERLRATVHALEADWEKACAERDEARAKPGPHPACRECGMGGDVGGTEPNPIPF